MASLLGWLGKKAQGVVAQINPADNGRTYSTVMNRGAAYAPKAPASVGQQLTHNGITNVAGGAVKAPVQFANTANLAGRQLYDTGRMMAAAASHNPTAFRNANAASQNDYLRFAAQRSGLFGQGTFFHNQQEAQSGALRTVAPRILGGTLQTAATVVPTGGGALAKGALAARVLKGAGAGAASGGAFTAGDQLVQNGKLDSKGIAQGALMGAALGGATPAIGAAASKAIPAVRQGAQKTAQAAKQAKRELDIRSTPTILNMHPNERYTLSDFAEYKAGRYKPENTAVLNQLQREARIAANKAGIDITSGSAASVRQRIAGFLDSYDRQKNAVKQGGYIKLPEGADAPRQIGQVEKSQQLGEVDNLPAFIRTKAKPRVARGVDELQAMKSIGYTNVRLGKVANPAKEEYQARQSAIRADNNPIGMLQKQGISFGDTLGIPTFQRKQAPALIQQKSNELLSVNKELETLPRVNVNVYKTLQKQRLAEEIRKRPDMKRALVSAYQGRIAKAGNGLDELRASLEAKRDQLQRDLAYNTYVAEQKIDLPSGVRVNKPGDRPTEPINGPIQRVFNENPMLPENRVATHGTASNTPSLPKVGVKNVSAIDKIFRSTRSVIERQGEHGQQLAGMLQGARDTQELYQAQLLKQLPTVRKLEDNDFENFVNATQGLDKPRTPQVAQAVQEWQTAHPAIRDRAVAAGLDVGNLGQTYYPHFVDYKAVFKDRNTYNEAINHLVQTGQAPSQEEAIKLLGYARDVSRNRQFGNLEASRLVDLPNYDKTPNSLVGYIQGSTRRVAHAETFGPKDENALKLITKAGQQGYDTEAAKNAYDVAVGAKQYNPNTKAFSNNVRRYLTTTRLGLGALTNSSQNVNTGIVTGHLRTLGAMVKQLDPKTRAFVQDTGTIADAVINDIREQSGFTGKVIAKITAPGFGAVEKFNRSVAATSGRDYALRLAQKGDEVTLRKLGVMGDISNRTLTDAQQIQAARKIVEKTQFKVDPQDLPGWVDSPGGKLVAQFRTFSYNQSKFFSNEILKPAAKGNLLPLSRLLAALPVGYGLYETKRRIAGRPQETDKKRVALESFGNVGGAGLAVDVFRSMVPLNNKSLTPDRRVSMAVGAFGGPAAGTTAEVLGAASNAAPKTLGGTADATQLARVGIRQIPILGTAIQNRTVPYKSATAPATSEPTLKQATAGGGKEDAEVVKQIKATAKGSDYTLQQLPSGKYLDQIGGDFKTFDTLKQARQAIGRNTFEKSGQSYKVAGDTVYRRSAEGTISATPKTKFDYQLGQATLTQQKNAGDIRGWLDTANKQLGSISKQLQDPAIDPLDALTLQNDATALQKSIKSYSSYGGFTKPKSGSISASFKTAGIKAPALPKITARKPANFKAPSVRKLAVSKIPTKFTRRKQTA